MPEAGLAKNRKPPTPVTERPLNPRQRAFADEFVICLNAAEAARRAGYSPKSATRHAKDLMANPRVKARINQHQRERLMQGHIREEQMRQELAAIAFFDPRQVMTDEFEALPLSEMGDAAKAIRKVKARFVSGTDARPAERHVEIEFHDKLGAIDKLAKHIGFYAEDKNAERQANVMDVFAKRLAEAAKRAAAYPISTAAAIDARAAEDEIEDEIEDAEIVPETDTAGAEIDPETGEVLP